MTDARIKNTKDYIQRTVIGSFEAMADPEYGSRLSQLGQGRTTGLVIKLIIDQTISRLTSLPSVACLDGGSILLAEEDLILFCRAAGLTYDNGMTYRGIWVGIGFKAPAGKITVNYSLQPELRWIEGKFEVEV